MTDEPLSPGHRWAITVSVMLVTVMQIIDTSVTNVVLPHLQGSLSAGVEEVAWLVTSYLAANAIVIPATGWLSSLFVDAADRLGVRRGRQAERVDRHASSRRSSRPSFWSRSNWSSVFATPSASDVGGAGPRSF